MGITKKYYHPNTEPQKSWNCLVKEDCPFNAWYLTFSILYQGTIKCSNKKYKWKGCKVICECPSIKVMQISKSHLT